MTVYRHLNQIAAIDISIEDHESLIAAARSRGMDVIRLSGSGDGIKELASQLAGREGVDSLHLLSHGSQGEIALGSRPLSSATLGAHSDALSTIGSAMSPRGEFLVYGCRVGAGEDGREFLKELARVTGTEVAASTDLTGNRELGGNWELEVSTAIVATLPLQPQGEFRGVLADGYTSSKEGGNNPLSAIPDASDGAVIGDFDTDGDIDVMAYDDGSYGTYSVFLNDGSGVFTEVTGGADPWDGIPAADMFFTANATYVADFDNDGDQDVWDYEGDIAGDGTSRYYENTDGSTYSSSLSGGSNPLAGVPDTQDGVIIGDFDTDGDVDVLAFDDDTYGTYSVFLNDGSGNFSEVTGGASPFDGILAADIFYTAGSTYVADFDNDGDQDIWDFEGNPAGDGTSRYFENTDGSTYTSSLSGGSNPLAGVPDTQDGVIIGDFDTDGDVDVLAFDDDTYSTYSVFLNDGSGNFSEVTGAASPFDGIAAASQFFAAKNTYVADLDNDGDQDIWDYRGSAANDGVNIYLEDTGTANNSPTFENSDPGGLAIDETSGDTTTVIHDVNANDGDGGATDSVTYSITAGNGDGAFAIDSDDGELRLTDPGALDHESAASYTLTIQADDGAASANTATQSIVIGVNDIAPAITSGQSFGVNESDGNGTAAGTVANTGDDDSVTFSILSGNADNAFAINAATGEITVADTGQLDASATGSYTLGIRATDGTTPSDESVTINVTDDVAPAVTASAPSGTPQANDVSVDFEVTFDEAVTGVTADDFTLTATGSAGGTIDSITGSGTTYTVTVGTITGDGTLRLDLASGTDIDDGAGNAPAAYTGGAAHTVDRVAPTVSDAHISLSGATGTGGAFKVGDTVTATWDDTGTGDNNSDTINAVTVDFSDFGGGAAVAATNSSDTWTATYTITEGAIDATDRNVSVTATDDDANATTTADTTNVTVDNDRPTVTDGNLAINSTGSGTGGAFIIGDTITLEWDNSTDGNNDIQGATADFTAFGGGAAIAMTDVNGDGTLYRASYTLTSGSVDGTNLNASVTVTDDAGNTTTAADTSNLTADNEAPTVSAANISITGASGTGGAFRVGDTVTATWDNTGTGDNNSDTIGSVAVDFSEFGGGSAIAASNSSGTWTATYTITEGAIDATNRNVSVTAADDAGNSTSTADTANATVDNESPGTPSGTLAVNENSVDGTTVGTVSGGTDGISYSLTDGANGRFAIAAGTGEVTVADGSQLDHENGDSHDITVRTTDDAGNTTDSILTVTVNDVNEAPAVDLDADDSSGAGGNDHTTSFVAGGAATTIADADAALTDVDDGDQIESLDVTLTARPDGDGVESLSLDAAATTAASDNSLTVGYTQATGVFSVSGSAASSVYQTILRGLQYENSDAAADITTGDRTIEVVANDGDTDSVTATATVSVVTAPVVDLGGDGGSADLSGGYAEGEGITSIAGSATVQEPDGDNLDQMVIELTNAQDGSAEKITLSGGEGARGSLTVNYDSDTLISISGSDTAANYQALLRELQYGNSDDDPGTTDRSITVQGRDAVGNEGNLATLTLAIAAVNDAPSLNATSSDPVFVEDGSAVGLFSGTAIDAVEAADNINQLMLTFDNLADGSDERLLVDGEEVALGDGVSGTTAANGFGYSVSVAASTATVTLTGNDTVANWQTLVDNLGYRNSSDAMDETDRVVTLTSLRDDGGTANGGIDTSALALTSTVGMTATDDAPTGDVVISGVAVQGRTLSADTSALADPDGLGTFTYQWFEAAPDGAGGFQPATQIAGETNQTYTPGADQIDSRITVEVSYTDQQGFDQTLTSDPTDAVATPPPPDEDDEQPDSQYDGVTVERSTEEDEDGGTTNVMEVPPVSSDREEQPDTPNLQLADIPLATRDGNTLLQVGLPTGVGLRAEEPVPGDGAEETGLLRAIRSRTGEQDQQDDQLDMVGDGQTFLDSLPDDEGLTVRTLIPSVADGAVPSGPIVISGNQNPGETPVALVIDTSELPRGTIIQLDNVSFAAFIGGGRFIGGSGEQTVIGDSSGQFIVLGPGDDQLRGGGGDDTVGSHGGDDQLFGGSGDDRVVGGADNDTLEGGSGKDVLQGGGSDAGTWRFNLSDGELVSRFEAAESELTDADGFEHTGPWQTAGGVLESDARLAFSGESAERLELVSVLYKAATGELPSLEEYNDFVTGSESDLALAKASVDHFFEEQCVVAQALEVQVPLLIEAVWGEGAATEALVEEGVNFITAGGSWGEAMLFLARAPQADALLHSEASDEDLVLVRAYETSESGWSQQSGNDILRGGAGNDRLVGGDGDDWLDGGEGTDVAVYTGSPEDLTFRLTTGNEGQGLIEVTNIHSGDTDTLLSIELLEIGGRYYEPDPEAAPIEPDTEYAVSGFVVELVGQAVESMDLAG